MLPVSVIRRWCVTGRSRSARWLRYVRWVGLGSLVVITLVSGTNRVASANDAVGPSPSANSVGRLAAARFVVALASPVPGDHRTYEVWIDGKRRINGLAANMVSPYLLIGSGERGFELRSGRSVLVGENRTVAGGSSTTFVTSHGSGPARLMGVPDSSSRETPSVRLINATNVSQTLQASGRNVVVAPLESSMPVTIPRGGQGPLRFEGSIVEFSSTDRGSRLLIVGAATDGSPGYTAWSVPSTRYPASLLPVDDVAPTYARGGPDRPPAYWIRRLLAGLVLVLTVAATITTLRSFRVQSLHSRVRARME